MKKRYDSVKRVLDIVGSIVILIFSAPLFICVALLVRLSSSGPVIFKQQRLTLGGRVFTMYKFRTMFTNAEFGIGAVWASANDPRVTKVGHFLRLFRLDELPQIYNVLIGDMSLIGPRPERPEFAETLKQKLPSFEKRLAVKAGITGLAQVNSGYSDSIDTYRKKLALDIIYVRKRSFMLDLFIAVKTIVVIVTAQGSR